jgi:hypothetical protein
VKWTNALLTVHDETCTHVLELRAESSWESMQSSQQDFNGFEVQAFRHEMI